MKNNQDNIKDIVLFLCKVVMLTKQVFNIRSRKCFYET